MSACIGVIEALFRYPVKSMAAEPLAEATLGFHGLRGDRRLALRRVGHDGGRPWLSASRLPELVCFAPLRRGAGDAELPTHVRTPAGAEPPVFSAELAADIGRRCGEPVQMMQLSHGMFDDADISIISTSTIAALGGRAGLSLDPRRFRSNLLLRLSDPTPFQEDAWLGGCLTFGDSPAAPAVIATQHDIRCSMINLDPDTAAATPAVLRACVGSNENRAGAYGTVLRPGLLAVGQPVFWQVISAS